jgi:hypothetical protein
MQNDDRAKLTSYMNVLNDTRHRRQGVRRSILEEDTTWERESIIDAFFENVFLTKYYPGLGTYKGPNASFAREVDQFIKQSTGYGIDDSINVNKRLHICHRPSSIDALYSGCIHKP